MPLITGTISDSAGAPANGWIEFTQVSRLDTGTALVTMATATAQVVDGAIRDLDGLPFTMPQNPDGSAVRVLERLGGRTFEWWAQVPATDVEYRSLVPVEPIGEPLYGPPPWMSDVLQARDETLSVIDTVGGLAGITQAVTDAQAAKTGADAAKAGAETAKTASEAAAAAAAAAVAPAALDLSVAASVQDASSDTHLAMFPPPLSAGGTTRPSASTAMHPVPVTATHNGFPGITRLPNGTYFAAWRASSGHMMSDGVIHTAKSTDGRVWSGPPVPVSVSDVVGSGDIRDLGVSVDGSRVMMTFYDAGTKQSYLKISTDNTATWGASQLLPFGWDDTAFISSPVAVTPSGVWAIAAYGRNATDTNWNVRAMRSTDKGVTWSSPIQVATGNGTEEYYEPNPVSTGSTNLIIMIRTNGTKIRKVTSTDSGVSWSALTDAFSGQGNPHTTRGRTGVLLCTYRSLDGRATNAGFGYAGARISRDNGVTWSGEQVIGRASYDMAYADTVETARDGEFICVWAAEQSITSATLQAMFITDGTGVTIDGATPSAYAPTARIAGQYMRLDKTTDQTITAATWTDVTFGTEVFDLWDGYDPNVPEIVTVNEDGLYLVNIHLGFTAAATGFVGFWQGSNELGRDAFSSVTEKNLTIPWFMSAANSYRVRVYTNAASTVNSGSTASHSHLQIVKLKGA